MQGVKPRHLCKALCKLYLNYFAYLQNIFCFQAYLFHLFVWIFNIPKRICFEKKYDCISVTAEYLWIPEVLLRIFRRLCIFSLCVQFNSQTVAFTKNVEWNLSNNSTEVKTELLFSFT